MTQTPFDPAKHLRRIRWQGQTIDYLDVRWRLVWLRADHPDAQIATEHIQITPDFAVFRATVAIPGQGTATGYGSARAADGVNHVEQAETAALGRALLALGYGTAYAPDFALPADAAPADAAQPDQPGGLPAGVTIGPSGSRNLPPRLAAVFAQARPIVDEPAAEAPLTGEPAALSASAAGDAAPAPAEPAPAGAAPRPAEPAPPPSAPPAPRPPRGIPAIAATPATPPARRAEPAGKPAPPGFTIRDSGPALDRPRSTAAGVTPPDRAPAGRSGRAAPVYEDERDGGEAADDPLADHDWSAFWRWARARGYVNRDEVERAIGQSIRGRTPREIRTLILNLDA